jgi:hypothetical protein
MGHSDLHNRCARKTGVVPARWRAPEPLARVPAASGAFTSARSVVASPGPAAEQPPTPVLRYFVACVGLTATLGKRLRI